VRPETVQSSGNLKYDVRASQASRVAELIKEAAAGRPIVVAGSTVEGESIVALIKGTDDEESYLLTAYGGRIRNEIGAMLVIAPRHPERFDEVWNDAIEFPTLRASELLSGKRGRDAFARCIESSLIQEADVIVLDTIGDLAAVYGIADVAFVGGSLVRRGGHNPLEPAQFGVPVVIGPSFENFRWVVEAMRTTDGIAVLNENADSSAALRNDNSNKVTPPEMVVALEAELVRLLTDRKAARALGQRGREVFESQQGATSRSVAAILSMIHGAKL
jgi:3-deoxy-D-manno-octulosonic-acid transferase